MFALKFPAQQTNIAWGSYFVIYYVLALFLIWFFIKMPFYAKDDDCVIKQHK